MAYPVNNISKRRALNYLNNSLTEKSLKEVSDAIFDVIFYGNIAIQDSVDVYYYCRAFNISTYGVEHTINNLLHDYIEENDSKLLYSSFFKVISRFPKGITKDTPLFYELLDTQLERDIASGFVPDESEVNNINNNQESTNTRLIYGFNKIFKKW